jgi:uncharacterized membrane protein
MPAQLAAVGKVRRREHRHRRLDQSHWDTCTGPSTASAWCSSGSPPRLQQGVRPRQPQRRCGCAGPPNFNTPLPEFADGHDRGTREVAPVCWNGRTVRFERTSRLGSSPHRPRGAHRGCSTSSNPPDPIVWWSTDLLFPDRTGWRAARPGRPRHDGVDPVFTFWQVTADRPMAGGVPSGRGHMYNAEHVDAWAAVLHPPDWNAAKSSQLRLIVTSPA